MPYVDRGGRDAYGTADTTGQNPGNWTVTFDPSLINLNDPQAEVYKVVVDGAATGATFNVYKNNLRWDLAVYAVQNSWDPQQTLLIRPGDTLYFYYSSKATDGHRPHITIHLKVEIALGSLFGIT